MLAFRDKSGAILVKMPTNKVNNKKIGDLGEQIATKFLKNKGFQIPERNYWRKFGEIDIVALSQAQARRTSRNGQNAGVTHVTKEVVHFVEVKSVSYETKELLNWAVTNASAPEGESWRPEELVHQFKLNQIRKAAEGWIFEHNWQGRVQIDVITVRMVPREKYARVKYIANVTI